jgi:hypothetical protein
MADRALRAPRGSRILCQTKAEAATYVKAWRHWRARQRGKAGYNEEWERLYATMEPAEASTDPAVPPTYYFTVLQRTLDDVRIEDF